MTTVALVVVGVRLFSALLAFGAFRLWKHMDRAERDARYRRRWLLAGGVIYVVSMANAVSKVISGASPVMTLLGLPIPLLMAWFFFRQAIRTKVPSDKSTIDSGVPGNEKVG